MANRVWPLTTISPSKVEEWDRTGNAVEQVIARAVNAVVGRGAYEAARQQYPRARLTLHIGIRVLEDSEE